MPDMCGSMKMAIMMVAPPLMIDERVLEVTLTLGSSTPAYNAAKTPTVHRAVAMTFMAVMEIDTPDFWRRPVTLAGLGRLAEV